MGFSVRQELTQWINSRANINGVTSIIVMRKCSPTSEQNFSNFKSKLTHGLYHCTINHKTFELYRLIFLYVLHKSPIDNEPLSLALHAISRHFIHKNYSVLTQTVVNFSKRKVIVSEQLFFLHICANFKKFKKFKNIPSA